MKNEIVKVYTDPFTQKKLEGEAEILKVYDGLMETARIKGWKKKVTIIYCQVRFIEDSLNTKYDRWVEAMKGTDDDEQKT